MKPMIQTVRLTKSFRHVRAVDRLDLLIPAGEIFGFIGPNGAGKTTTIKILATLLSPTSGHASIDGIDIARRPLSAKKRLGYMPDHIGIYDDMLVEEYLHFFAAAYRIYGQARAKVVDDVLILTDLDGKRMDPVRVLSRGMTQRLGLARVLLHDPEVLLLDEPAAGLDPRARVEFKELLAELSRLGKTIFISSHILAEIGEICSSIAILEAGRLLYQGSIDEVKQKLSQETGRVLRIRVNATDDATQERAKELLRNHPFVAGLRTENASLLARLLPDVDQ